MEPATLTIETSEDQIWPRVTGQVNAWRGACMQCFAQAEAAVTETLIRLGAMEGRGSSVRFRHLIGQRFEDLAHALGSDGPFQTEGRSAMIALEAFRVYEPLRTHLAHGVARVAIERNGSWIVVLRSISLRSHGADRTTYTVDRDEAEALLADLRRRTQRLASLLLNLRKTLNADLGAAADAVGPVRTDD